MARSPHLLSRHDLRVCAQAPQCMQHGMGRDLVSVEVLPLPTPVGDCCSRCHRLSHSLRFTPGRMWLTRLRIQTYMHACSLRCDDPGWGKGGGGVPHCWELAAARELQLLGGSSSFAVWSLQL